jgi:hypothetical protein
MMYAGLCVLRSAVEIVAEDVVVEDGAEANADAVGDVEEFVAAHVGEGAEAAEEGRPFGYFEGVGLQEDVLRGGGDVEGHELVYVVVDVGEVHEGAGVEQSDCAAEEVLAQLRPADGPEFAVLLIEFDVGRGERVEGEAGELSQHVI